jgi:hypothetical protein
MVIERDIKIQKIQIIDTIAKSSKILHALIHYSFSTTCFKNNVHYPMNNLVHSK